MTQKNLKILFEYDSNLGYYSDCDTSDASWVLFDFKERPISVSKYTIKFGAGTWDTQKFKLQGSNDKQTWATIDNRKSDSTKHDDFSISIFLINQISIKIQLDSLIIFGFIRSSRL